MRYRGFESHSLRQQTTAGLPALQSGEPGQVRKEAATAGSCKCRGLGSPPMPIEGGLRSPFDPPDKIERMSYQVLARKWRPRSFAALVGQEHVVRALRQDRKSTRLNSSHRC